ncbi:hypothetical protein [Olivibacter domesticus]|uniref:Phosphatidate cytidylyltransferase n=1 Tax=Olivibacter domesticus TaxID=407022 RepID=A0A1H7V261_OLID1|nr:hypothetical protein [Olivibacter domesticus]SEM03226.1 hypothetical protein SAMN05661044_04057 [Olivibacter domesticus]
MKRTQYIIWPVALLLLTTISGCDFIAGVFKGGVYVGVFLVLIVIAIIIWLVSRTKR